MWLRDSLARDCPQLRIWTYGYDSRLQDPNSIADVYEYAQRFRRLLPILRRKSKVEMSLPLKCE